jgi:hypothetical protein
MPDIKRESTSLKIDPNLWKEAKIEAIRNDMELSELVEEAITEWLEKKELESRTKRK